MRKCIKCDARVRNHNPSPKINFCSDECKRAIKNDITREEQIARDIQEMPYGEEEPRFQRVMPYGSDRGTI